MVALCCAWFTGRRWLKAVAKFPHVRSVGSRISPNPNKAVSSPKRGFHGEKTLKGRGHDISLRYYINDKWSNVASSGLWGLLTVMHFCPGDPVRLDQACVIPPFWPTAIWRPSLQPWWCFWGLFFYRAVLWCQGAAGPCAAHLNGDVLPPPSPLPALDVSDIRTMSGFSVVTVMVPGNLSCVPRSAFSCQSRAVTRSPPDIYCHNSLLAHVMQGMSQNSWRCLCVVSHLHGYCLIIF